MHPKRRARPPKQKTATAYAELWHVIDGAVADAFRMHPEYIPPGVAEKAVRASINKRAVGLVLAYAVQRGKGRGPLKPG